MKFNVIGILTGELVIGGTSAVVAKNRKPQPQTNVFKADSGKPSAITSLNPNFCYAGGLCGTLYIVRNNFTGRAFAKWNGSNRETKFVYTNLLALSVLPGDILEPTTAQVAVCDQHGKSTNAVGFEVKSYPSNGLSGQPVPRETKGIWALRGQRCRNGWPAWSNRPTGN